MDRRRRELYSYGKKMNNKETTNYVKPHYEAPIALIVFNRPRETKILLEEIRKLKPKKLFIIADGPRLSRPEETKLCLEVREIATAVDWECEVKTDFSAVNLGCKKRVITGLDWVFENTDRAIILEDDCIPSKTFFTFANELLEKYKNAQDVGIISGTSIGNHSDSEHDYYFSKFPQIWGWATWKRVWDSYDGEINDWQNLKRTRFLRDRVSNSRGVRRWRRGFDGVYKNEIDTWDFQLVYALWKQDMKTIVPTTNLISNIGFGPDATHTLNAQSDVSNLERRELTGALRHPVTKEINSDFDRETEVTLYEENVFDSIKGLVLKSLKKFKLDRKAMQIYAKLVNR